MGLKGGGSSGGSGTTTTEPWSGAQPYLKQIMSEASKAYGQTSKTPYGGDYYAPYTADQLASQDYMRQLAPVVQQQVRPAMQLAQDTAGGKFLDPSTNPAFQAALSASIQPAVQTFRESVVPGINSAAISQGAYGGARNGLALGRAAQGLSQEITNTAGKMSYQNYATERGYQNDSAQLIAQALGLQEMPGQYLNSAGTATQTQQQALLDQALQKYQDKTNAPWAGLEQYANLISGASNGTGQTTTKTPTNMFGNALSGAIGGTGLAAGLGSLFAAPGATGIAAVGGPWTLGLGAAAGLIGGLFG